LRKEKTALKYQFGAKRKEPRMTALIFNDKSNFSFRLTIFLSNLLDLWFAKRLPDRGAGSTSNRRHHRHGKRHQYLGRVSNVEFHTIASHKGDCFFSGNEKSRDTHKRPG